MKTVLFVCVENTFRSVVNGAIFNALAPPVAVELLQEIGIQLDPKVPRLVSLEMVSGALSPLDVSTDAPLVRRKSQKIGPFRELLARYLRNYVQSATNCDAVSST